MPTPSPPRNVSGSETSPPTSVTVSALARSSVNVAAVVPEFLKGVTPDIVEAVRIRVADKLARLDVNDDTSKDSTSGPARIASRVMRAVQPNAEGGEAARK